MAASTRDSITQRIALEGAQDVLKQLQALGQAGEEAFKKLAAATAASNSGLGGVSGIIDRARTALSGGREALTGFGESFKRVGESAGHFREQLGEVGERILPHFKEVLALATGAGIAGFIELSREAAKTTTELAIQSRELGIPATRLQALGAAAGEVGVKADALFQGLLRLNRALGQVAIDQKDKLLDLGAQVTQGVGVAGITVLRGSQKAAMDGLTVLRGGAKETQQIFTDLKKYSDAALPLANRARQAGEQAFKIAGIDPKALPTVQQFQATFSKMLETNQKFREESRDAGFAIPFQNVAEVLTNAKDAGNDLAKMFRQLGIATVDANGKARPVDEVLVEFAKHFEESHDKSLLAVQAFKIFGDQYAQIIPVLAKGGAALDESAAAFTKLGISFDITQLAIGQKLDVAYNRLSVAAKGASNTLILAFAPAIQPLVEGLTEIIKNNAYTIRTWATTIATEAVPAVNDLLRVLKGEGAQTQGLQSLVRIFTGVGTAARAVGTALRFAFSSLSAILSPVADLINKLFGTEFTGQALVVTAIVLKLTGVFRLFAAAISLGWTALTAIYQVLVFVGTILTTIAGAIGWPAILLAGLVALGAYLLIAGDGWTRFLNGVTYVWEQLKSFANYVGTVFTGAWDASMKFVKDAWNGAFNFVVNGINTLVAWFDGLWQKVKDVAAAIAGVFSGGSKDAAPAAEAQLPPVPQAAEGGLMRGPGTGTSDSILARLSDGEFVVKARAVYHYGSQLLHRLNRMELPRFASGGLVPGGAAPLLNLGALLDALPKFASGGLVPAGAGGAASFNLGALLDALPKFAEGGLAELPRFAAGGDVSSLFRGLFGRLRPGRDAHGNPSLFLPRTPEARTSIINLSIDGTSFNGLSAPDDTANNLVRYARGRNVRSAGRAPGWSGG